MPPAATMACRVASLAERLRSAPATPACTVAYKVVGHAWSCYMHHQYRTNFGN